VGSVSVWVQGDSLCCRSGAALDIGGSTDWIATFQQSGQNNCNTCFVARVNLTPSPEHDYAFSGSASDWHLFEIDAGSDGLTFKFDGSTVFTDPSYTSFRTVDLTIWAGLSGTVYFDDFTAQTTDAAPEPGTLILLGGALVGLMGRRCWPK
jgi:hypothetical protein